MSIECAFFGMLGRDAESKVSGSGKRYLRLNVRTGDGDAAQWLNVMCFDADAVEAAEKMVKGARVYIEGKLSLDEWTAQDGSKRHGLTAVSWHCRLSQIGRNKPPRQNRPPAAASGRGRASTSDYAPIGAGTAGIDDDIPFAPEVH
ncbi:single-stranded DNA-binding protein [Bradyrhizobium sp. RT10b]|uniref:single-stranded DNA-binding protein n=1 Tax=Bradyrhizobium sp. RT10b TaxID=3156331 RepID=UPI0033926A05